MEKFLQIPTISYVIEILFYSSSVQYYLVGMDIAPRGIGAV